LGVECKICHNLSGNNFLAVPEMMIGTQQFFEYLVCPKCCSLQLLDPPSCIADYYPANYYSYTKNVRLKSSRNLKGLRRTAAMRKHLGNDHLLDKLVALGSRVYFPWLKRGLVNLDSKILDVGCGSGFLVQEMSNYGFTRLLGIDAFLPHELEFHADTVAVRNVGLEDLEDGDFDLIMFHHSFEHLDKPLSILQQASERLAASGTILIRTPVADSFAFRTYKQNWVQIDAPRHLYVYSVQGLKGLALEIGLNVEDIVFDSNSFQFAGSECYKKGLPLNAVDTLFSRRQIQAFQGEAERLNAIGDGDSACFYIKRH